MFYLPEKFTSLFFDRQLNQSFLETHIDDFICIFENLPITFYWIDKSGKLICYNKKQAHIFGINDPSYLLNKNIFDIGKIMRWSCDISDTIRRHDLEIMHYRQPKSVEENVIIEAQSKTYLSLKHPVINKSKHIRGICGIAFDISQYKSPTQSENSATLEAFKIFYANEGLSHRESECLYYLVRGMTQKQIGRLLNISYRTVECYLNNVKFKLGCRTRQMLISKVFESGIIQEAFAA